MPVSRIRTVAAAVTLGESTLIVVDPASAGRWTTGVTQPGLSRQVMLDAGRKYWDVEYLENLIRQMSWHKMNTLFLHLSDAEGFRLYSPKFPGLADPDVSYAEHEIARLRKFAARHHVLLVPGIDVPGHATVISEAFDIGFGAGHTRVSPPGADRHRRGSSGRPAASPR